MQIEKPGSHIDHLLRQTRMHHMHLSGMADRKANMLLSMASLVITLSIPQTVDSDLRVSALILIGFCLITIILSAYAAMPKVPLFYRGKPSLRDPGYNLLFFGDFTDLTLEEYSDQMEEVMNSPSATYETQVREIYTLGQFLANRKYRYVQLAYIAFISGLVVGAAALVRSSM